MLEKLPVDGVRPPMEFFMTNKNNTQALGDFDRERAMHKLAQVAMPSNTIELIANVDAVLVNAMASINQSLQQSSQHIDQARQQLMQEHPALSQAYLPNIEPSTQRAETQATPDIVGNERIESVEETMMSTDQETAHLEQEVQSYQHKVLSAHDEQQQQAMAKQQALSQAAMTMQQELMAKQQAYQHSVLGAAPSLSESDIAKKTAGESSIPTQDNDQ